MYTIYPLRRHAEHDPSILVVDETGDPNLIGDDLQELLGELRNRGESDIATLHGKEIVVHDIRPPCEKHAKGPKEAYWAPLLAGDPRPEWPDFRSLVRAGVAPDKCDLCGGPWHPPGKHKPAPGFGLVPRPFRLKRRPRFPR